MARHLLQLQERFNAALTQAREIRSRIEAADEPTAEDRSALDAAIERGNGLTEEITAEQRREAGYAALEARAAAPAGRQSAPMAPHTDSSNTRGETHQYSLLRAIQGDLAQREGMGRFDGLERETHDHLVSLRGKASAGLMVPWDAPVSRGSLGGVQRRTGQLTTTTGAGAIPLVVRPTMIDLLRARLVLSTLGANVISDMSQPFALPKTTTGMSGSWVSTEGTGVTASNPAVGQVPFGWKSVESATQLTRQFIASSSVSAENYIVDQLVKGVSNTVEQGAITGAGTSGQPKGLLTYTQSDGISLLLALGANGAAITWAQILSMTGAVDTANAPDTNRAWLFNPTTVSYLQGVPKVTGYPTFILGDSKQVAGYDYASTSNMPSNLTKGTLTAAASALAFGSWSELVIALFSGLDLFIDPYSSQPHVNVKMVQDVDVNFLHLASFATCLDLKTS
jgi:HK97 family phage major capsid protein